MVALQVLIIYTFGEGADKSRWASRTSNPLGGINSVFGGFDSHTLPPISCLMLYLPFCNWLDARFSSER